MNTCLICNEQEPGSRSADVDFICSDCILLLTSTTQDEINKQYIEAIKTKAHGVAYALYTFTSKKTRELHPLKNRR